MIDSKLKKEIEKILGKPLKEALAQAHIRSKKQAVKKDLEARGIIKDSFENPNYTPKYKAKDLVIFNLSYATVLYEIQSISFYENIPLYNLRGKKVLVDNETNSHMTEARSYNPFCWYFDSQPTVLVPRADLDAEEKIRKFLRIKNHPALE